MAHYKNQRGSAGEKIVEIYLLKKGLNTFAPSADGNRDLILELGENCFYGVQVKAAARGFKEKGRNDARYKFNFNKRGKLRYPIKKCQVFALVCLKTNLIHFALNTGQKQCSIKVDSFTYEDQEDSFESIIQALNNNK